MGIWEVQTYTVLRDKEETHDDLIKKVGEIIDKMGKKYLYFDKLHGPWNHKVLVITHENFADLEKFETDWFADEELSALADVWLSCIDYESYRQTFWQEHPL